MPHFSPISWLFTGLVFYVLLGMFISLLWWSQSYYFPGVTKDSSSLVSFKWNWK